VLVNDSVTSLGLTQSEALVFIVCAFFLGVIYMYRDKIKESPNQLAILAAILVVFMFAAIQRLSKK
jgi:predicted branched-subunit amino acid permease